MGYANTVFEVTPTGFHYRCLLYFYCMCVCYVLSIRFYYFYVFDCLEEKLNFLFIKMVNGNPFRVNQIGAQIRRKNNRAQLKFFVPSGQVRLVL